MCARHNGAARPGRRRRNLIGDNDFKHQIPSVQAPEKLQIPSSNIQIGALMTNWCLDVLWILELGRLELFSGASQFLDAENAVWFRMNL